MKIDVLNQMAERLELYLKDSAISQAQFAKNAGISPSYVTHAINRNWTKVPAGKDKDNNDRFTEFSDAIAFKIMAYLKMDQSHWDIDNFYECQTTFLECKEGKDHRIIDGPTGTGKTYAAEYFRKKRASETFLITSDGDMTHKQFMLELARLIGVNTDGSIYNIRQRIQDKIKTMKSPLIIIDEAENLKISAFRTIKALYDHVKDYCGIVLIGANFLEGLEKKAAARKHNLPQFFSRFSGNNPVQMREKSLKDTKEICEIYAITDRETVNRLHDSCSDFRELNKAIQRILRDRELPNVA